MKSAKPKTIAQNLKFSTERKSFELCFLAFRSKFLIYYPFYIKKHEKESFYKIIKS